MASSGSNGHHELGDLDVGSSRTRRTSANLSNNEPGNAIPMVPILSNETPADSEDPIPLRTFDIFALIVNKMIGTGIFTGPALTYKYTRSKGLALGIWIIGFLYSLVSMALYLDYARAFPYTGGELVYLDEITAHDVSLTNSGAATNAEDVPNSNSRNRSKIFSRPFRWLSRLGGDGLLAYTIYSFLFTGLFNSATNALQFGRFVLEAAHTTNATGTAFTNNTVVCYGSNSTCVPVSSVTGVEEQGSLLRFIGIAVLSILCLVQWLSPGAGRKMNQLWAIVKIMFLIALIIVGATTKFRSARDGWGLTPGDDGQVPRLGWVSALLSVIFSFEGWENATFVAGEVPIHQQNQLRKGFYLSVVLVGLLYLVVVLFFLLAIPPSFLDDASNVCSSSNNFAAQFTGCNEGGLLAWTIVAAISALGSLNSIIYTFSRVKQAIGHAKVLPWSRIWRKNSRSRTDSERVDLSPQGGLVLHWIMSVIMIAGTASIPDLITSIVVPGYLQSYTHALILMVLSAFCLRLPSRNETLRRDDRHQNFNITLIWVPILLVYISVNMIIIILLPLGASIDAQASLTQHFNPKNYSTITFTLLGAAIGYYFLVFGTAEHYYVNNLPLDGDPQPQPLSSDKGSGRFSSLSVLRFAKVRAQIWKEVRYNDRVARVKHYGRRWRISYVLDAKHQHEHSTQREQQQHPDGTQSLGSVNFIYWFFGGASGIVLTPWDRMRVRMRRWWPF